MDGNLDYNNKGGKIYNLKEDLCIISDRAYRDCKQYIDNKDNKLDYLSYLNNLNIKMNKNILFNSNDFCKILITCENARNLDNLIKTSILSMNASKVIDLEANDYIEIKVFFKYNPSNFKAYIINLNFNNNSILIKYEKKLLNNFKNIFKNNFYLDEICITDKNYTKYEECNKI